MFPEWLKSPIRVSKSPKSPRHFSCSSFKDIQTLLKDDPLPQPHSPSIFHRFKIRSPVPDAEPRSIVLYFTTLRVVRKTFDDCRTVRSILRSFRVPIDERDLSMDSKFLEELQGIFGSNVVTLPRVFIGGTYVGGAEDIKRLHESGDLAAMIQRLRVDGDGTGGVCDACGGLGFALCDRCNGSNKIYSGKSGGFRACACCNVNGLIRCPSCRTVHRRCT